MNFVNLKLAVPGKAVKQRSSGSVRSFGVSFLIGDGDLWTLSTPSQYPNNWLSWLPACAVSGDPVRWGVRLCWKLPRPSFRWQAA